MILTPRATPLFPHRGERLENLTPQPKGAVLLTAEFTELMRRQHSGERVENDVAAFTLAGSDPVV